MITVEEADQIIFDDIKEISLRRAPLQDVYGKVLREDISADRDLPPFHRVTMDGIAINFDSYRSGNRVFLIEGVQPAGSPAITLKNSDSCVEIMTGAVLTQGCTCVVPIELVDIDNGSAKLKDDLPIKEMTNVHAQGSDYLIDTPLVSRGDRLFSPQIAVAAATGKFEVIVSQTPKIAVVGTGDELVPINLKPEAYQIRQSNSYALQSALKLQGYDHVARFHLKDNKEVLLDRFAKMIDEYDVLVISGGVSRGKFDFIPEVLEELKIKVLFHKVNQRPGKPFWFGKSKEGKPVFALPGNPVSTQVGLYRYVLPYLNKLVGAKESLKEFAVLSEDVDVKTAMTCFLAVKIESEHDGRLSATPVFPNSSGDFASLAGSDGFIELPPEHIQFPRGTAARLYRWKF